ncbi:hypothetical protein [Methanobrevibacter olleyae]|uniref:Uncharacterized protein n=1 Tax=Methanobrevibacter olleyae TaxID=294671 RepID=A0A126R2N3_METOL|nr:hypothetical protein [Methanobrevibacter olleyae]AMK16304.1 hypothetical protein YLM1_1749 [Methanobrevibacter olleyae]
MMSKRFSLEGESEEICQVADNGEYMGTEEVVDLLNDYREQIIKLTKSRNYWQNKTRIAFKYFDCLSKAIDVAFGEEYLETKEIEERIHELYSKYEETVDEFKIFEKKNETVFEELDIIKLCLMLFDENRIEGECLEIESESIHEIYERILKVMDDYYEEI